MDFECEKPMRRSEPYAWKATNLTVITCLTSVRLNSEIECDGV